MRILGIDPGINGGCALYCSDSPVPTVPSGLFDVPTIGEGNQREINYAAWRDLIWALRPDCAVIEIVNAFMPTRKNADGESEKVEFGSTSLFRFGGSYYVSHCVVACLDIPYHRVSSSAWKGHFGLKGKKKSGGIDDSARQVALRRWPSLQPFLTRKGDQHRAEAFLMAVWFAETDGGRIKPSPKKRTPAVRFDRVVEALNDAPDVSEDDDETTPE